MSLPLLILTAWLVLTPLAFGALVLLLPAHLHRRVTRRYTSEVGEVIELRVARDRRRSAQRASTSRAV